MSKISFDDALEIGLEAVDPQHHQFALLMLITGARLAIEALRENPEQLEALDSHLINKIQNPT